MLVQLMLCPPLDNSVQRSQTKTSIFSLSDEYTVAQKKADESCMKADGFNAWMRL